jgi:HEAT repeat-containing protein 5
MFSPSDASQFSSSDLEAIIVQCAKSLDSADQVTRHAHAQLVGHLLASTQIERVVPPPEASQKGKKDQTSEQRDDDISSSMHAAAEITKPMLTPSEMLSLLSVQFHRFHGSRKTRIGIFDIYATLLTKLGASFVESHYSLIVSHLAEITSNPRSGNSRYDTLLVRSLVGILLRDLIGVRMLSEQGQISAIQELANTYLKRWPAMMPGQMAPPTSVLVVALREVAGLLQQLGNAPPPVQVNFIPSLPFPSLISLLPLECPR